MILEPIEDLGDSRIAPYRHLKWTNETRDAGLFVVEGVKLLDRLVVSRFPIASALATERLAGEVSRKLPGGVPLYVVPDALIDDVVGFHFHQGVLACGIRRPMPTLDEVAGDRSRPITLVVCPRLDNPENLGAIARIGDVFGVDAVVVGGRCPDPLSRRVLRVSMGSALGLPVIESADLESAVDHLRLDLGVELAAAVVDRDAEPIDDATRPDRFALMLGSESAGLDPSWIARADRRVTIPMRPGVDSLNVAVAAGILLHRFRAR